MNAAAWFALGAVSASIVIAAVLWVRSWAIDAERWGTRLRLESLRDDPYYGLEDVKLRVKPVHDWKRTGEL